jgi:hypothetical protein
MNKKLLSQLMSELGKRGGKIGGKRRMETLTAEQRSDIARKAGAASAMARQKKAKKAATKKG